MYAIRSYYATKRSNWSKDKKVMDTYVQKIPAKVLKPPVTSVGVIGWMRANLFNGWFNSLLTIVTLYVLWIIIPPFIRFV